MMGAAAGGSGSRSRTGSRLPTEHLGNGKYKFQGKVGIWHNDVGDIKIFFPDDGSEPIKMKSSMIHWVS